MSLSKAVFTLITGLAVFASAAPALSDSRLQPKRILDIEPHVQGISNLDARDVLLNKRVPLGECTSSSGCPAGMCCSQYGYCGVGTSYCGSSGGSGTSPAGSGGHHGHGHGHGHGGNGGHHHGMSSIPAYSPPAASGAPVPSGGAPAYSAPAPTGSSPASAVPAPSGGAPGYSSPPESAAPSPTSGATAAPSASAPAYTSNAPPAPSGSPPPSGGGGSGSNSYKMYSGDGSPSSGWPSSSNWASFDALWSANVPTIKISCSQFSQANPTDSEVNDIQKAIQQQASASGMDARFILAVMMQESKGCVRVWTTDNGVTNPGLMQSHDGTHSCNPSGTGINPCPWDQINGMLQDGVQGTAAGDGLKQTMAKSTGSSESQKYYQAATIYNSGNLPQNLDDNTATACYASDIANRMMGWTTAATQCTL